jgi:phage terminase small subunit
VKLTREASKLKKKTLAEYDITDRPGLEILNRALEAFCRMRQAEAILDTEGLTTTNRFGEAKEHPAVSIERKSRQQFLDAIRRLNLDVLPPNHQIGRPGGR